MKIKKVVILAAGESSRFWPLARRSHKAFYRIGFGQTIIEQTVTNLLAKIDSIKDIILIVSPKDLTEAKELFKDFNEVKIVVQKEPTGQGNAILLAEKYLDPGDIFFITTGDKINSWQILTRLLSVQDEAIALRSTDKPQLFGIVTMDKKGNINSLVEKPQESKNSGDFVLKVVSAYLLNFKILKSLKTHSKDHYGLEKALGEYLKHNGVKGVLIDELEEYSLKFPWQLLEFNKKIQNTIKSDFIHPTVHISPSAKIVGPVYIDENAIVGDFAKVVGPVFIGKNSVIGDYSLVRENTFIDDNVLVGSFSEVKNSLIYQNTHLHRNFIGDSIIDSGSRVGAGTIFANRRIDRSEIATNIKDVKTSTGLSSFGAILGESVNIGINCSVMPGVKLGSLTRVYPQICIFTDTVEGEIVKGGT